MKKDKKELDCIEVLGAKEHNLKNIDVKIPKKKLVVITGVSGSGKSSLAFDTIFAEGQRRYVESLSAYARQFLGQMEKPKYDTIKGLSPTIAIEQKSASKNPRSTVGTITEINDYLRVLFARVGVQHCYKCQKVVGQGSVDQMMAQLMEEFIGQKIIIFAPLIKERKGEFRDVISNLVSEGFVRARVDGVISELVDVQSLSKNKKHTIEVVVDRIKVSEDKRSRIIDSLELAIAQGEGEVIVLSEGSEKKFSTKRSCCSISYPQLEPTLFSFNSPKGMCSICNGIGSYVTIDPKKVVPDESLSIAQGAVKPWDSYFENGEDKGAYWGSARYFDAMKKQWGLDFNVPWRELSVKHKKLILYGSKNTADYLNGLAYKGVESIIVDSFRHNQEEKDGKTSWVDKYIMYISCPSCEGSRLNLSARNVRVCSTTLPQVSQMSIDSAYNFFKSLKMKGSSQIISEEVIKEIRNRLGFLVNVGLNYLSLSRSGNTLSGGESQRIRLASQIGSELTGVLYVLDEPSIGLHQRDNLKLISMLKHLRDIGNTVLVVEHDEETMMESDYIIDMGPGAGHLGGEIVFKGTPTQILKSKGPTGQYLSGRKKIDIPAKRRESLNFIEIIGAKGNNLKNIDVKIPLEVFTSVCGVSGAGKSTLINQILCPALSNLLNGSSEQVAEHKEIRGLAHIDKVISIDQKPIGRTPRSNPATYTKLFDHIRDLFASLPLAKSRGYQKGRFSFNVKGGRCEECQGGGYKLVEMHFLADVMVTCDACNGKRFNKSTLEVFFKKHSISDVLELSVDKARDFFSNQPKILKILKTLQDVGLGYIALGQAATTMSGGEAQRIKLSRELAKRDTGRTLYVLDEPTTGLHFEDIQKLLNVLHTLVDKKNSVLVIEHNLDVIKTSDYVIDMGPEGGEGGGSVVSVGTPEKIAKDPKSVTGKYLKPLLG